MSKNNITYESINTYKNNLISNRINNLDNAPDLDITDFKKNNQTPDVFLNDVVINVAICDDDAIFLNRINNLVTSNFLQLNIDAKTTTFNDALALIDTFKEEPFAFDVVFLDIDMPKLSGLDVAKTLREFNNELIIVFVSSHEQYARQSIEYAPFRYIKKDNLDIELLVAIKAVSTRLTSQKTTPYIFLDTIYGYDKLLKSKIMYIDMSEQRVTIHCTDGDISTHATYEYLLKHLQDNCFVVYNRCSIVNIQYISSIKTPNTLILDNGAELVSSFRRISAVRDAILKYWRIKLWVFYIG